MKITQLLGIKKLLLPPPKEVDLRKPSGPLQALFGAPPETSTGERGRDLMDFLKQVALFEGLRPGDLRRLARIVHERSYRDGEYIFEQGKPGTALYLVRSGIVEIVRRKRNGEEVSLVLLEPPASFEELAAMGADVVRWISARTRGPVSLVAFGRSDMDALSRNFPVLANKILAKLAQIIAMRTQMLLETGYFNEESET
jgi:CRP/FNR family transcriptional regulator, cyclic AMP receptor protein